QNKEDAIIFNTGYQGNLSAVSAILNKKVLKNEPYVFSDRLNHNSLHTGCAIAMIKQIRYNHLDMKNLENLLKKYPSSNRAKFILSETVFGMDGDMLDIHKMTEISEKYNAFLYLDEAHSIGVCGNDGYGMIGDMSKYVDCCFGTFGKAIGCAGAYLACNTAIKNYLVNNCPGFIYSTALPPPIIGAITAAWDELPKLSSTRNKIKTLAKMLKSLLEDFGFLCTGGATNIISIVIPNIQKLIKIKEELLKFGILVTIARPPTVPINKSRIRVSICARHTKNDIEFLAQSIKKCYQI
ncbi:aminotransferase class I/II-fold pyridoxal phosphate-dependent enzyme, partial [Candidatus Xenohaliotis californiensis]|uniref:aminotransferase class I/II-fold pyridoxal phosphate-dependent enzyme n=1 Tax=Candidatus Xenohaliotis californiensis TaxID=84677 RepID=UPI0030C8202E